MKSLSDVHWPKMIQLLSFLLSLSSHDLTGLYTNEWKKSCCILQKLVFHSVQTWSRLSKLVNIKQVLRNGLGVLLGQPQQDGQALRLTTNLWVVWVKHIHRTPDSIRLLNGKLNIFTTIHMTWCNYSCGSQPTTWDLLSIHFRETFHVRTITMTNPNKCLLGDHQKSHQPDYSSWNHIIK